MSNIRTAVILASLAGLSAGAAPSVCNAMEAGDAASVGAADTGTHGEKSLSLESKGLSFRVEPPTDADSADIQSPASPPSVYATKGSRWWTLGTGIAHDFDDATDIPLRGAYSYFLEDGVEFSAELGAWYFSQPGNDAVGLSGSVILRWHFFRSDPWTAYIDGGLGILGSTDDVPSGGTSFNFMPQAGVGATRRLNDNGLRLQLGARWHHISNARINGDDENPDRDAPLVYMGLIFPF